MAIALPMARQLIIDRPGLKIVLPDIVLIFCNFLEHPAPPSLFLYMGPKGSITTGPAR